MSRNRLVLVALATTLALAGALPAGAQLNFGTAELGEIRGGCVSVCFGDSNCSDGGPINTIAVDPPFFVRGIRRGLIADDPCSNPQDTNAVNLPVALQPGQAVIFDVDLVATGVGSFDRDIFINGSALSSAQAGVVPAGPCPPSATDALCLQDERFTVRSTWRTQFGTRGKSPIVQGVTSDDSGLFYFFNANNWEILLKVLDGCSVNNRFWVFAAATTNVEYTITVTDTQEQQVRSYFNPLDNPAQPIQDTQAFATCP